MGLFHCSATNLCAEIAWIAVLPAYQRTHVASNAVGVLLKYCLESEHASPPGLGLRRVQWVCHWRNVPSATIAERMGFKREALLRWDRVLPPGKEGNGIALRDGDRRPECAGRDTVVLGACWDDWEGGVDEKVKAVLA